MPISNRWSGAAVLPYGPGWGANTPGGVASCMTWDATNGGSAFRESRRLAPYRPASASISSGETPYFLKPNLSYERRMRDLLLGEDPSSAAAFPAVNHPSTQAPESSYRRGPSRCCDARQQQQQQHRTHRCCCNNDDDDPTASCNRCSDVVRATNATGYTRERCPHHDHHYHHHQHHQQHHMTPRPPSRIRKEVQFEQEDNNNNNNNRGRVIEIFEDRQGNPVKMTITRPTNTAINRPYSAARETCTRDQNERWATRKRYVRTDPPEMTSPTTGCDAGDLRQIVADDVKRLMEVYQAGKADASFHKGIVSPKWSSNYGRPEQRLEEMYVEEHRQDVTSSTSGINRWPDDVPVPIRPGYPERRGCYGSGLQESRTVVSRLHRHRHGVRGEFPGDGSSQNDKVKVQVECPANSDTVVNLRVRASDVDYQFR